MHNKYGSSDSIQHIDYNSMKPTQQSSYVTLPLVEPQFGPTTEDAGTQGNLIASKKYSLPEPRFKKISGKVSRGAPSPHMLKPMMKPRDPSVPKFASHSSKMIVNSASQNVTNAPMGVFSRPKLVSTKAVFSPTNADNSLQTSHAFMLSPSGMT